MQHQYKDEPANIRKFAKYETIDINNHFIDLWLLDLEQNFNLINFHYSVLVEDEKLKANEFIFYKDFARYVIVHSIIRQILACMLDCSCLEVSFTFNKYNKPFLKYKKGHEIYFNISYSKDYAVIATYDKHPIGIDIEHIDNTLDISTLTKEIMNIMELSRFLNISKGLQRQAFFKCWTQKEAIIKSLGVGFSFPIKKITTCIDPKQGARLISIDDNRLTKSMFKAKCFYDLYKDYSVTICIYTGASLAY